MGCCGGGSSSSGGSGGSAPVRDSYTPAGTSYSGGTYFQTSNPTSDPKYPGHSYNSQQFTTPEGDRYKTTVIVGPDNQVCATAPRKGVKGSFLSGLFNFLK